MNPDPEPLHRVRSIKRLCRSFDFLDTGFYTVCLKRWKSLPEKSYKWRKFKDYKYNRYLSDEDQPTYRWAYESYESYKESFPLTDEIAKRKKESATKKEESATRKKQTEESVAGEDGYDADEEESATSEDESAARVDQSGARVDQSVAREDEPATRDVTAQESKLINREISLPYMN